MPQVISGGSTLTLNTQPVIGSVISLWAIMFFCWLVRPSSVCTLFCHIFLKGRAVTLSCFKEHFCLSYVHLIYHINAYNFLLISFFISNNNDYINNYNSGSNSNCNNNNNKENHNWATSKDLLSNLRSKLTRCQQQHSWREGSIWLAGSGPHHHSEINKLYEILIAILIITRKMIGWLRIIIRNFICRSEYSNKWYNQVVRTILINKWSEWLAQANIAILIITSYDWLTQVNQVLITILIITSSMIGWLWLIRS